MRPDHYHSSPTQPQAALEEAAGAVELAPTVGGGLILMFVVACVAMHMVQPELSPVDDAVSFYMNGRLGWILSAGIVAMGMGSLLLLRQLLRTTGLHWRSPHLLLLGVWAVGCVIAGMFPPDPAGHWDRPPSLSGLLHSTAAMALFLSFPLAAMLLSGRAGRLAENGRFPLRAVAWLSLVATILFFGCLAPVFANRPPVALGLAERVVLAVNIWWLLLALQRARAKRSFEV